MKKFIVVFVAVVALFSLTAHAEAGDKQFIVIKNGENVTIYAITDRGANMYGNKDATIDVNNFVNPAVRDLRAYDVPEAAWKMCSMSENGTYDSYVIKAERDLTEVKANYENEVENTRYLEEKTDWHKLYDFFSIITICLSTILIIMQRAKINKLKEKIADN